MTEQTTSGGYARTAGHIWARVSAGPTMVTGAPADVDYRDALPAWARADDWSEPTLVQPWHTHEPSGLQVAVGGALLAAGLLALVWGCGWLIVWLHGL